jgi:hypothetical protein
MFEGMGARHALDLGADRLLDGAASGSPVTPS